MTISVDTCEIIPLENRMFGDLGILKRMITLPEYYIFESYQMESRSNKLFISNTVDDQSLLILVMGN